MEKVAVNGVGGFAFAAEVQHVPSSTVARMEIRGESREEPRIALRSIRATTADCAVVGSALRVPHMPPERKKNLDNSRFA